MLSYDFETQKPEGRGYSNENGEILTGSLDSILGTSTSKLQTVSPASSTHALHGDERDDTTSEKDGLEINESFSGSKEISETKEASHIQNETPKNIRCDCVAFLRELFFLTRNFHWERR